MIEVRDLQLGYDGNAIVKNLTLNVARGETLVILGQSGAGKTTLLRSLIGLLEPSSGQVVLDGQDITHLSENELNDVRKKFGVLFQSAALFNSMNLFDNVALPIRRHTDLDEELIEIMVKLKLEMVGLSGCEDQYPDQLSGGMKKRAGLARAMALDPQILFLDEPNSGLDPVISAGIDELIVSLKEALEVTMVIVSHDLQSAFRTADRITLLAQGEILASGTPDEIREHPDKRVQRFLKGVSEEETGGDFLESLLAPS